MDQQAKSTFTGIMAAVGALALIAVVIYGIYYAATGDQRRSADLKRAVDNLECATDRAVAASKFQRMPRCD